MKTKNAGCSRNPATGAARQERTKERPGILSDLSRHPAPAHSPGKIGVSGLLIRRKSKKTGAMISIWRGENLNLDFTYVVKCDTHGALDGSYTWDEAVRMSRDPAGWCEKCRTESRVA